MEEKQGVEKRKVDFDRLEDRVLPCGAGIIVSSESISRLLAEIGDSSVLAIGSYDAWPTNPGLTTLGAAAAGAGIAAYGVSKLRDKSESSASPEETPPVNDDEDPSADQRE